MHRALGVSLAALLAIAPAARAQTAARQGLRSQLEQLFVFGSCGEPLCLDVPGGHGSHFLPAVQTGQTSVVGFITESVARGAANIPISATSSGATYAIVGGLPVRTSTSAGPIFSERSQTLGRGRFFLGTNVSGVQYSTLNGVPTDDLRFAFSHENVGDSLRGEPDWENDIIDMQMQLDVSQLVASVFATWGITDFMDIGVAIPFVRVGVQGTSTAQINAFGPGTPHYFAGDATNPVIRATSVVDASAAGLGDIVGRLKVNLGQSSRFGAALLGEVRFATGDEEDLLGAGSTNARGMAVAGMQFGSMAVRTNAGYIVRTGELATDAALVTLGFDNQMTSWATLAFDLLSDWQVGESPLTLPGAIALDTPYVRTIPATNIPYRREDRLDASLGVKFNVRGGTVLVLNGIVPLKQSSLQPNFIWTVGLDFNF
jgi:hypothetical protein